MVGKKINRETSGRIEDMDRSFDRSFWQELGTEKILKAAWQMVEEHVYYKTGKSLNERRLDRTLAALQRQED